MKRILFRIFKPKVFKRALYLRIKQRNRIERVKAALRIIWNCENVLLSQAFFYNICDTLRITHDKSAENFIWEIVTCKDSIENIAKNLPL